MDHTGNLTSVFGFYRNTIAVSAHCDNRILKIGAKGAIYHTGQSRMYLVIDLPHLSSDMFQCRACLVADFVFFDNTSSNFSRQNGYRI